MVQSQTVYINFTGGIVSPGHFKSILELVRDHGIKQVRFGLRQQLIIDVPQKAFKAFITSCDQKNISVAESKVALPNIISSYPAAGIFSGDTWVREGVYKDVFSLFDYRPKVKINICDGSQRLVPLFTGHINWVSSASVHFWHLYIRFPKSSALYCFPGLVYTNDIALVSKKVEELLLLADERIDGPELSAAVKRELAFTTKAAEHELLLPAFSLPYYEGFNRYDNNYWLGIYRRDEFFQVPFLLDVCELCLQTRIGQLYTTPWKSLVIKGIELQHRPLWEHILGRFRINVRHAANELNWQVEDDSEEGLQIKRHIIRYFDKEDVRTFGLSFAVQTRPHSRMFGPVIIRKEEIKNPGRLKSLERFEILYTAGFNSNSNDFISFRKHVEKEHLGTYLVSVCKLFYDQQQKQFSPDVPKRNAVGQDVHIEKAAYQCRHCYTVYDESLNGQEEHASAQTSFNSLPDTYECPLCGADKEEFVMIDYKSLLMSN